MSGYPYGYHSNDQVNKIKEIKQKLESNGAKKIILLLDDSHDFGTSLYRFSRVYTPVMVNFYNTFLKFVIANHNIGFIIKPKKYINEWDGNKNLVFVTHYVVISEALNYAPSSGEIVISNIRFKKIGNIEIEN